MGSLFEPLLTGPAQTCQKGVQNSNQWSDVWAGPGQKWPGGLRRGSKMGSKMAQKWVILGHFPTKMIEKGPKKGSKPVKKGSNLDPLFEPFWPKSSVF